MEIVYSILEGINKVVRDLDPAIEQHQLCQVDFDEVKKMKLTNINVIKKEIFDKLEAI
jgi:hypothetical protein